MQPSPPAPTLNCTQCGGELHPDESQIFLTCPYCGATVYLDKAHVVFHWYVAPTLNETQARESLMRWMAGNQTVKDLDRKARITAQAFQYFPVWYFKRGSREQEQIELQPAAATSVTELRHISIPAGDLRPYEASLEAQSLAPSVPLEAATSWAMQGAGAGVQVLESALVHIPLYTFKYVYQNQPFTALVEAGTGATLANIYPAKAEAPYLLAGGVTALVFLSLAALPVLGSLIGSESGFTVGLTICLGLGVLAVPALLALAAWVAAKV
ncbi:MAG: zinc ribbon-containing protein [Chloroflexi bacterium]|nr:zinc ribbon-containing protein [Chloroflexota bacterium]